MAIGRSAVSPASVASPSAPSQVPSAYLLARIRSEFNEMPGLRLTLAAGAPALRARHHRCSSALTALESAGFLTTTRDGAYVMAARRQMTA